MKREWVAGIDLGGTSLLAVIADAAGKVLGEAEADTPPPSPDPAPVVGEIGRVVREAARAAGVDAGHLLALGIGAPGSVDPDTGFMAKAVNLGWLDVPLTTLLQDETGLPSFAAGDVQAAIIGEHAYGAARGAATAIGVWIGTGLGGGLIIGGEIYRGHSGAAGEIGHMVVVEDGPLCGCGRRGCIEAFASRTAIERDLRAACDAGRKSVVLDICRERGKTRITSGILKRALKAGDELTREVLASAQEHLGVFVANILNVLDPEVVVLGGGLIEKLGEPFVAPIRARAHAEAFRRPGGLPRIVPSTLGDYAGALGASELARRRAARSVASLN